MPRGLNGTHRELSLTGVVASDIWRPPALAGPCGSKNQRRLRFRPLFSNCHGPPECGPGDRGIPFREVWAQTMSSSA